ncbi:MAG TPA: hypothetical protein VL463_00745 [Kofleriaceae bacterium]|nr:hypothetical protein [Kofleriaceae bacterium]
MAQGDWSLTVTGTVARVDRENIDKSGRNPRFNLSIVITPEALDAPKGVTLPVELVFRIAERDLAKHGAEPKVGEKITVTGAANGPKPRLFSIATIKRS